MEARRDVFQAIADPTRRTIIDKLAHESLNLNTLAEGFNMSRQAITLHVKILEECGLVSVRQQGRERICEAKLDQLAEISVWIEQYRTFWEQRLDRLEKYLLQLKQKRKHDSKRK